MVNHPSQTAKDNMAAVNVPFISTIKSQMIRSYAKSNIQRHCSCVINLFTRFITTYLSINADPVIVG